MSCNSESEHDTGQVRGKGGSSSKIVSIHKILKLYKIKIQGT